MLGQGPPIEACVGEDILAMAKILVVDDSEFSRSRAAARRFAGRSKAH